MNMRKHAASFGLLLLLVSSPLGAIELGGKQVPKEEFRVILCMGDSCIGGWSYHSELYAPPKEPFGSDRIWRLPCLDEKNRITEFRWVRGQLNGAGNGLAFPVSKYLTKAFPDYHFGYNLCWSGCAAFMQKHKECLDALTKMSNEATIVGVYVEWNCWETRYLLNEFRERRPADPQAAYTQNAVTMVNLIRKTLNQRQECDGGQYPDDIIMVYHWGLRDRKVVKDTTARAVGRDYRLQVEDFAQRRDIAKTMVHNASAAGNRLDLPIYTDAEPLPKSVPPPSGGPSAGGAK